jgi:hypothetical protein
MTKWSGIVSVACGASLFFYTFEKRWGIDIKITCVFECSWEIVSALRLG